MPMDEAILDCQSLGIVTTPGRPAHARRRRRRPPRDGRRLVAAVREAGLKVEGIDLSAFGMVRALRRPKAEGAVLYVNVAGLTNVAVANASGCLFTRAAAGGLDAMVHTLAERRGLTPSTPASG